MRGLLLDWMNVRVFAEPDWDREGGGLLLLKNASAWELAALLKTLPPGAVVLCHERNAGSALFRWVAGVEVMELTSSSTRVAREWIQAHLARQCPVVWIEKGFSSEFMEEVVMKSRLPLRVVVVSGDEHLDLDADRPPLERQSLAHAYRVYYSEQILLSTETSSRPRGVLQSHYQRLARRALDDHPELEGHLASACVRSLKARQFQHVMVDAGQGDKEMKGGMLLAVAWQLADQWREWPDRRVGVVLPPGIAATLVNLACLMTGRTPVNLNFTAGRASMQAAMRIANIRTVVSAQALQERLKDFPWPERVVDISVELKHIDRIAVIIKRLWVGCRSSGALIRRMGLNRLNGGREEAGLLFTSGSSGEPKGVVLSHRNILANLAQISAVLPRQEITSLLGCLPVFHSFGFTVGLWWPLVSGPKVVTYPSPLELAKIIGVIERHNISLYVTTPTFLRSLMKKAERRQLRSLRMVVTGAEKLPPALKEEFEKEMGIPVCEGYGMTETSPVISVNRTARPDRGIPGPRTGSVGPMLPGVEVRACSVDGGEHLPPGSSGILWFAGSNVFSGYLGLAEKNSEVLQDGWYCSGDVGRLDDDGFLYIEGRISRFSKIAGEMVPHGTVESALIELMREQLGREINVAIFGKSDEAKGEALVALVEEEIDSERLRSLFMKRGLPNLWWPRKFIQLEALPLLASGKLDLKACQERANELG